MKKIAGEYVDSLAGREKYIDRTEGITEAEWEALPVTFGVTTMARLMRCNVRYVQDHAAELGGRKVVGRWLFSKTNVADLLGI